MVDTVFEITCEGVSASELVRMGEYEVSGGITDALFPINAHPPTSRTLDLVRGIDVFDHDPTTDEVLAEFRHRGLERPTYEDALVFVAAHPEVLMGEEITVFLHEPVMLPDPFFRFGHKKGALPRVLVHLNNTGDLGRLVHQDPCCEPWLQRSTFVAVKS